MQPLTQTQLIASFQCLGDACADTCCQNWSMQVDDATLARYRARAPELLDAVDMESDGIPVMKRDPVTRHCIKMDSGFCGIHKQYGSEMLGDACHFYPRVTRSLGKQHIMTATSSCPEIVRLALVLPEPFSTAKTARERLPSQLKNYLPDAMEEPAAMQIHQAFLNAALDPSTPWQQALLHISSVARSMELLDPATWHQSVPLYLRLAASRLPKPEKNPADAFNLLHALCGLIVASRKPMSARLTQTIRDMETALACTLDWESVGIRLSPQSADSLARVNAVQQDDETLRRMLALQLSLHLFPFAGLGENFAERITFIGVRVAIMRLALSSATLLHGELPQEETIRIVQSLSRFLDHLGDAAFSLSIYRETGWVSEPRLAGLLS